MGKLGRRIRDRAKCENEESLNSALAILVSQKLCTTQTQLSSSTNPNFQQNSLITSVAKGLSTVHIGVQCYSSGFCKYDDGRIVSTNQTYFYGGLRVVIHKKYQVCQLPKSVNVSFSTHQTTFSTENGLVSAARLSVALSVKSILRLPLIIVSFIGKN